MRKLLASLLLVPCLAHAEFETGNKLYQNMTSTNNMERMYALGYVGGVFDAYQHMFHCPPPNTLTLGQVFDLVKNYLEANPAIRHQTGDVLIRNVLKNTWPCVSQPAPTQAPRSRSAL